MIHDSISESIVRKLLAARPTTKNELLELKRAIASEIKTEQPSTAELRLALTRMQSATPDDFLNLDIRESAVRLLRLLKKRDVRTQSGVAIITVLTKPYPCPGKCVYCPTEVRMPKSYIASEPAAARALLHEFDPYAQVSTRIQALKNNGHPTDKIELIAKGGTWSAYPWQYQLWFIRRCFDACNEFDAYEKISNYKEFPHAEEQKLLERAHTQNERAKHRIIGLTLETRPDWIRPHTIWQLRTLGCTRVELGVQHTDNEILAAVKRGHTTEQTMRAMMLLRQAGFKVDAHTMPQLPGATPEKDYEMYKTLFDDSRLRPDMIKIYPCVVVPSSELAEWHRDGRYEPYPTNELTRMLIRVKSKLIPRYCRISRLIRDIPGNEIIAGNKITNLRETVQQSMSASGLSCVCLRCREIARVAKKQTDIASAFEHAKLFIESYRASEGAEYFLSFEDENRTAVFAFLRLYLPDVIENADVKRIHKLLPETSNAAFVRELNTYGFLVPIDMGGSRDEQQHRGLGKRLMQEAERIAKNARFHTLTVISGVGVRGYYEKLGFSHSGAYMVKSL